MRNKVPYFFLGLAAVLAAAAFALLIWSPGAKKSPNQVPPEATSITESAAPDPIATLDQPSPPESPEKILETLGVGLSAKDPTELLNRIGDALEKGDIATVSKLIGKQALDSESIAKLQALTGKSPFRLRKLEGVHEIGELELNKLSRWALDFKVGESGRDRILFDLRNNKGKWMVEKMILPLPSAEPSSKAIVADSLGVADGFIQAVLKQDFEIARKFVDPKTVSEAKIAALCILFEEGEYRMRSQKPLRAMFSRGDTVGYLANVETKDGTQSAQFALNLRQPPAPANWLVSEINLDALIADYAKRVAGGDVYYSPLVSNPSGGETLALYFGFDEDSVSDRTRRQLEIVASMLKSDPGKKITLSGYTDALGTKQYNDSLSANRADVVRDFLAAEGVPTAQIITLAKGASQPRRPNITENGEDNPEGRRANRRTEIYLDF